MEITINCTCPKCGEEFEETQDVEIEPEFDDGWRD